MAAAESQGRRRTQTVEGTVFFNFFLLDKYMEVLFLFIYFNVYVNSRKNKLNARSAALKKKKDWLKRKKKRKNVDNVKLVRKIIN